MSLNKQTEMERYRQYLVRIGALSRGEIDELVNFEFRFATEDLSLADQVRRYYLRIKTGGLKYSPAYAERMMSMIGNVGQGKEEAIRCLTIIQKYLGGTRLYVNGEVVE